ncbi:helix-turn-helix domain-containing protein [Plantibacter flavus]|uniref:helix-turn-helix domain-containing protein n=1 Tax=Plantibacter flavus TaxID=150123 RepID=UPI002378CA55|nr:helix-turn-helix domain-containing protein [Plantibacter flavus]MDD9150972.1 helix-turn-helix domain-containing protein [Plantibacter flavus]
MNSERSTIEPAEGPWSISDDRAFVLIDMLSDHRDRRRHALRTARSRRWLDSYGEVVVRSVLLGTTSTMERDEYARALRHDGRDHTLVLDHVGGFVLVTSERRAASPVDEWVRSVAPAGVRISAIGSAVLHADEDDLLGVVDEARTAAEIVGQVGDALGSTRAEDLGGWRLLHAIGGGPQLVTSASPAADELWHADPVRRETVETYLDAGCNVVVACERLHIHRTTLYYRLDTMPEVVRDALADGLKRSTLHLSLKLLRLWNDVPTASERSSASSRRRRVSETRTVAPVRQLHPQTAGTE